MYGLPGTVSAPDVSDPERFEPTPWEHYKYDANDNAGRAHASGAVIPAPERHWNTPTSTVVDALGRVVSQTVRNGQDASDWYTTRNTHDLRGNVIEVIDPLGRTVQETVYDLANRALRTRTLDSGITTVIFDAAGREWEVRDARGALTLGSCDMLGRRVRTWARDNRDDAVTLRERFEYGDEGDRAPASKKNQLGRLVRHYDEAGLLTIEAYDFRGNIAEKVRRCVKDELLLAALTGAEATGWSAAPFVVNWAASDEAPALAAATLEQREYRTSFEYDALDRVTRLHLPAGADGVRRALRPAYDSAGALVRILLDYTPYVHHIAYDARGQRTLVAWGNGILTRYAYDAHTARLTRLRSERCIAEGHATFRLTDPDRPIQDATYAYDAAGNLVLLEERTPSCGVRDNREVGKAPNSTVAEMMAAGDAFIRTFTYDPLYRLTSATGREDKQTPVPRSWIDQPRAGYVPRPGMPDAQNASALAAFYREEYEYDPAGNLVALRHTSGPGTWVRHFGFGGRAPADWAADWRSHNAGRWTDAPANHLTHAADDNPSGTATHTYDECGNLLRENMDRHCGWDHRNRLRLFRTQMERAEPSVCATYLYDSEGRRVRKMVRRQGGQYATVTWIDALFEHCASIRNGVREENTRVHVMDGETRIESSGPGRPWMAMAARRSSSTYRTICTAAKLWWMVRLRG